MPDTSTTDITVNVEGLWLLQALLGIEQLAPELMGRPYGAPRNNSWVTEHPGLAVLVDEGIADEGGVVRADIAERMTVLAAPDVELVIMIGAGPMAVTVAMDLEDPSTWQAIPEEQLRIIMARRGSRWASAVRTGTQITIDDCAPVDQTRLEQLVVEAFDSVHQVPPASISAVNVPLDDMLAAANAHRDAGTPATKAAALCAVGLRGAALAEIGVALEDPVAEAALFARAYADTEVMWSDSVLNLRDTPSGRVALYRLNPPPGGQQEWMTIAPATPAQISHAVTTVIDSVGVRKWASHERM
jgi:EspG family